jgi:hypothetical protein
MPSALSTSNLSALVRKLAVSLMRFSTRESLYFSRFPIAVGLALAYLFGAGQASSAPALLGQTTFTGATGGELDIDPTGQLVYIASGFGQTGLIRIDASNPLAMTQTTLASGWGGGVAVDPGTGRYATTNGFGGAFRIFNPNDTVFSTSAISGCGGNLAYGGSRFAVSTQCSDHIAIFDSTNGAMLANIASSGVGSSTAYNSATGTFFQDRTPGPGGTNALAVSPSFSTTNIPGFVQDANGVTNRIYVTNGGGTQILDGTTYAVLATVPFSGAVEEDTSLNRFYIGSGSVINIFDGVTDGLVDSILLPGGQLFQSMDMEDGSGLLYVITSGGGNHLLVYNTATASGVPEPAPIALMLLGMIAAGCMRLRRS